MQTVGSKWIGRWVGRTVVCIASGPSLTEEDCEAVRASGHPSIVTNNTFQRCPWADVLFAFDVKWWKQYRAEVDQVFHGELVTASSIRIPGLQSLANQMWFKAFGNSGAGAVSLAVVGGASKVVMIGFDAQKTDGKAHWHGDHVPALSNVKSIATWPTRFALLSAYALKKKVRVVNCSLVTALTCFERGELEQELLHP